MVLLHNQNIPDDNIIYKYCCQCRLHLQLNIEVLVRAVLPNRLEVAAALLLITNSYFS